MVTVDLEKHKRTKEVNKILNIHLKLLNPKDWLTSTQILYASFLWLS